jgi:hypothetical protein
MKTVLKFGTGVAIPEGAVYLSTQVEKTVVSFQRGNNAYERKENTSVEQNTLVWHYFLVDVENIVEENGKLKIIYKQNPQNNAP